jgi:hypothetical protein
MIKIRNFAVHLVKSSKNCKDKQNHKVMNFIIKGDLRMICKGKIHDDKENTRNEENKAVNHHMKLENN